MKPARGVNRRLGAILAAAAVGACGGDDDGHDHEHPDAEVLAADAGIDAAPREVITETIPIEAGGPWVEGIMTGGPDDYAVIHLELAAGELDWNIHGHADGGTQELFVEYDQTLVDHVFVPPAEAQWWLLIRNSSQLNIDVQLRVELYGDLQWEWQ